MFFNFFFRALQVIQNMTSDFHRVQNLSLFLATQNKIKDSLRDSLQKVELIILKIYW